MLTAGGLAQRVRARRGPMTGSGVTRLFIVSERRITLRSSALRVGRQQKNAMT